VKVSVLCFDLSNNCLGRAYIIAKALQRYYDVEIIGPAYGRSIWEPVRSDTSVKYKLLKSFAINPIAEINKIDGDVIYASKPKGMSFGYGMIAKTRSSKPLILDVDDWEVGFYSLPGKVYSTAHLWDLNNFLFTYLLERSIQKADHITVSNTFLQRRFGGILIPHFRDTKQFDPARFDNKKLKQDYLGNNNKVILFLGTLRKNKGIPELIQAVEHMNRPDVTLLIVGATRQDMERLPNKPFLKVLGRQPFTEIPKYLALADLVAIFQTSSKASQGQLPAKIFDAMSMAKPIIASKVSDLPKILEGCGEIVDPGDVDGLAKKMGELLDNPKYAEELGKRARQKCIEEYSYDAIAPKLHAVVEGVVAKARKAAKA
jgi:glycosyltransferase involved in cell wall biosynthesis